VAEALAAEGCDMMLCGRDRSRLDAAAAAMRSRHAVRVETVAADLDRATDVARAVEAMRACFGGTDILVSNSGGPAPGDFAGTSDEQWNGGFERTLMSAVRLARGFLPGMRTAGFGRIIHITSISVRQPIARLVLSNAFRAAVTGMAKTLSDEVAASGITVNCIAPGYIATDRLRELFEDRAAQAGESFEAASGRLTSAIPADRRTRRLPRLAARGIHHRRHDRRGRRVVPRGVLMIKTSVALRCFRASVSMLGRTHRRVHHRARNRLAPLPTDS
jgi:3-oxoacyl-[acyl-carrier protein] reductase